MPRIGVLWELSGNRCVTPLWTVVRCVGFETTLLRELATTEGAGKVAEAHGTRISEGNRFQTITSSPAVKVLSVEMPLEVAIDELCASREWTTLTWHCVFAIQCTCVQGLPYATN